VLQRPWQWVDIVKHPKVQALQDVLSLSEVAAIINTTRQLRYQVYYLTTYSLGLGLRLSETLNLTIADIDSHLMQVHLRYTKSKKDRFIPLPQATLLALRHYWKTHRHPSLLFPGGSHHIVDKTKRWSWTKAAYKKPLNLSLTPVA
jgi:integrase